MSIIHQRVRDLFVKLNMSQKLYFIAITLYLTHLIIRYLPDPINNLAFSLGTIFIVWAVTYDLLMLYKLLWASSLGKGILLLGYAVLVNVCLSVGTQYVNNAVGVEPYLYKHAIIFSSVMSVPVVMAIALKTFWFLIIAFGGLYLFFWWNLQQAKDAKILSDVLPASTENHPIITVIVRLVAIATVSNAGFSLFSQYNVQYNEFVVAQTKAFLYHFESLDISQCEVPENKKFLLFDNDKIVLVSKGHDGYDFELVFCNSKLERT